MKQLIFLSILAIMITGCTRTVIIEQNPKYAPREPLRVPKYLYKDPDVRAIILPVPRLPAGTVIENIPPTEHYE